ncbi:MAG: FtsX-like permease family protein [Prosthecobacter sp.]
MSAVSFLARRYLRAKRSFVSVITVISILGVAVGVLMMVVVNAVMQGFERDFRQALIGYQPHLILKPTDGKPAEPSVVEATLAKLRLQPGIHHAMGYVGGMFFLEHKGNQSATELYGLPSDSAANYMVKMEKHRLEGTMKLTDGGIVMGDYTAADIGGRPGDRLVAYASSNVTTAVNRFREASDISDEKKRHEAYHGIKLQPIEATLLGYTRSESAGHYAYTTLATARQIFGIGEKFTGIMAETTNPNDIKAIKKRLEQQHIIPSGWKAVLWTDSGDARLAAMSNERFMMFFIIGIIGLVAAFAVMNTTITVTTQKRREIGVLAALGARQAQIVQIFVSQAAVVGVVGTLSGLSLSALVLHYRNDIRGLIAECSGVSASEADLFLSTIPAQVDPTFIAFTAVGSIFLCLAAALPPAWLASRVDPAVALRD